LGRQRQGGQATSFTGDPAITLLSDEFLLTKAKPPKGGDAKLRD